MRTKQTTRAGATGGKPAHFLRGGGPAPGTAGASGAPIPGHQGGKAPCGWVPPRRRVVIEDSKGKCCLQNDGSQCNPQGYYKPLEKQKQFKLKPGTHSLCEIWFYQKSTALLLRRLPFLRLIREVAQDFKMDLCFTAESAYTLHSAAKDYLVRLFKDSNLCTIHAKHVTIMPKDIQLAHYIRGEWS